MATTPDLQEPLITAARAQAWHQAGDSLLTLEAARTWLNEAGLLLFAPRAGSLGAPAPSLVEGTLGKPTGTATLQEAETARSLTARLVGEGSALPLNLLGGPGDLPDFLVSAQAFPFVFTLRGDKGWKRPPETSGSVKVTPLGLRVYELITEKGALTVSDIVSEAGREVTESAVARALGELWQMLRVIPVLQQGEGDTRWELTTSRFVKAVKAGANAGQPTALSALISLYLGQVYVATEEEIAAFLSPLTARSRVRDALHGLTAGRQLTEGVVNGKTVLYIPDALPDFAAFAPEEKTFDEAAGEESGDSAAPEGTDETGAPRERIQSFGADGGRPQDRNLRGKPVGRSRPAGSFRDQGSRPPRPGVSRQGSGRPPGERGSYRPRTGERPAGREGAGGGFGRPAARKANPSRGPGMKTVPIVRRATARTQEPRARVAADHHVPDAYRVNRVETARSAKAAAVMPGLRAPLAIVPAAPSPAGTKRPVVSRVGAAARMFRAGTARIVPSGSAPQEIGHSGRALRGIVHPEQIPTAPNAAIARSVRAPSREIVRFARVPSREIVRFARVPSRATVPTGQGQKGKDVRSGPVPRVATALSGRDPKGEADPFARAPRVAIARSGLVRKAVTVPSGQQTVALASAGAPENRRHGLAQAPRKAGPNVLAPEHRDRVAPESGSTGGGRPRPSFGGGSRFGEGRPPRSGDRPEGRPGPRGGSRPPAKRAGSAGRPAVRIVRPASPGQRMRHEYDASGAQTPHRGD